jgi:KDO2-lipid IV(A) lauroyltransferase
MRSFWIKLVFYLVPIIGNVVGFLWFDVLRIRRQVALQNVALAFPEKSAAEHIRIARSSLLHFGKSLVEYFWLPLMEKEDFDRFFEVRGAEIVEHCLAEGKGVYFLCLHIGNGDLSTAAVSRRGWPVSLISKSFKTQWLNRIWFKWRGRHGTQFISPEKSSFEILRSIKNNRIVIFVLDQFMGPPIGCKTKFFGRETGTAMGLAVMAERTQSPVIPVSTHRKADGHHMIEFSKPIPWRELDLGLSRDQNIRAMTQVYTDKIEEIVRAHPDQWMWIHRRWKNFG